ncbi:hypothetical protein VM1G_09078 [Cytospora mali]|uniref:Uncharacterized protein n=1 Tax=Cytospora mali TaxID=578113 RepID=A0A194WAU9_CYTMA|nr:hypothetical protein VM1G_09078 [Valsa mali]
MAPVDVKLDSNYVEAIRLMFAPPNKDYFLDHPEHEWPAEKFQMRPEEMFITLPKMFNHITLPLLDRDAYCRDVSYASALARNRSELFQLLQERREQRQKELVDLWLQAFSRFGIRPGLLEREPSWPDAMRIAKDHSFDTLVRFFASFLPDIDEDATPPPALPANIPSDSEPPTVPSRETAGSRRGTGGVSGSSSWT